MRSWRLARINSLPARNLTVLQVSSAREPVQNLGKCGRDLHNPDQRPKNNETAVVVLEGNHRARRASQSSLRCCDPGKRKVEDFNSY